MSKSAGRALAVGVVGAAGAVALAVSPAAAATPAMPVGNTAEGAASVVAGTPVPPGGPDDVDGNGILDSSETPDKPDS